MTVNERQERLIAGGTINDGNCTSKGRKKMAGAGRKSSMMKRKLMTRIDCSKEF